MTFNENVILDNKYQIIKEIGSGGTGVVYLAYHMTLQKYVVLKRIRQGIMDYEMMRNEADLLKNLHHTYLPQVYDCILVGEDFFTVIDYIEGYSLEDLLLQGTIPELSLAKKWMTQLAEVLVYLHSRSPKIIHSDIKPANILITKENNVCLIDFNISLNSRDDIFGFSECYASPEQILRAEAESIRNTPEGTVIQTRLGCIDNNSYKYLMVDERTDIYSLGATFYHLVSGITPSTECVNYPLRQIMSGDDVLMRIIDKCMAFNSDSRYQSASELLKALRAMYKLSAAYKRLNLVRRVSVIAGTVLICTGVVMLIKGLEIKKSETFHDEYKAIVAMYNARSYQQVIEEGQKFLHASENKDYLDEEKKIKAKLIGVISSSYFVKEDYDYAAYYGELALEEDDGDKDMCKQYIISLIRSGENEKAQNFINKYSSSFSSYELTAFNMELYYQQGKYSDVISALSGSNDKQLAENPDALVLCGQSYVKLGQYEQAVGFFAKAYDLDDSIYNLRQLADVNIDLANRQIKDGETAQAKEYSLKAKECYANIISAELAVSTDYINYLQCCSYLGDNETAQKLIYEMTRDFPDDYKVFAEAAKYYYDHAQTDMAADYAAEALEIMGDKTGSDEEIYYKNLLERIV